MRVLAVCNEYSETFEKVLRFKNLQPVIIFYDNDGYTRYHLTVSSLEFAWLQGVLWAMQNIESLKV